MVLNSHRCTCQCRKNATESQQSNKQEMYAQYLKGSDRILSRSYRGFMHSCPLAHAPSSQFSPPKTTVVISESNLHFRTKLRVAKDASLTALSSLQRQLHHLLLQQSSIFSNLGNSVFFVSGKDEKNCCELVLQRSLQIPRAATLPSTEPASVEPQSRGGTSSAPATSTSEAALPELASATTQQATG